MPNPFDYVGSLTDAQKGDVQIVRDAAKKLYEVLEMQPRTRSMALAITKLEECAMWAIKSITHGE